MNQPVNKQIAEAASENQARKVTPRPLLPGSCTWRDFGSRLFQLMLPQAFILQSSHPVINAGVAEHSVYKTDPWGRGERSVKLLWPVVYARPDVAIQKGIELRELHRRIKGVDKETGKKYHALDPEAYAWVHGTGFDATIRMHEYFGKTPTTAERKQIFAEWRQMGTMLGIREEDLPRNESEYWVYFESMIKNKLIFGEVTQDLLGDSYLLEQPKPPVENLPDFVWNALRKPLGHFMRFIIKNTLPESFRNKFNIELSKRDQSLFRVFCAFVRLVYPLIPERSKYLPLAWNAIQDSRRHPEAYTLPVRATESAVLSMQ